MPRLTRRDVLRASAGAAAAVPIAALGVDTAGAASVPERHDTELLERAGDRPLLFAVHDPQRGEVSILRGTSEVVVRDRRLVARLLRATHRHGRQNQW